MKAYLVFRSVRWEGEDLLLMTMDKARAERTEAHYDALNTDEQHVSYYTRVEEFDRDKLSW
jgi:hypothetical protein